MNKNHSRIFFCFALFYVVFAYIGGPLGQNRQEFFPFFNWSLFTNSTRTEIVVPVIFIDKLNGRDLPQPVLVNTLKTEFPKIGIGISLRKTTMAFLVAHLNQDEAQAKRLRQVIEDRYLVGPEQVSYSYRWIKYKPLERIRNDKFEILDTIATYERR